MNIEKLKAAALAANQAWMDEPYEIEPALVLELIERLEAAENQRDELLNALKEVKSVGHGVIPKHVWMTVEEAIASVKEQEK